MPERLRGANQDPPLDAFFSRDGDRFLPSELTRGPWDPSSQHAGPPAALLGRAVELHDAGSAAQVGRITFDILRPIPIAPLSVAARVIRPGRSVELLAASLSDHEGEVVRAAAWRIRTAEVELPPQTQREEPPPGPERGEKAPFVDTGAEIGYHTAMEARFVGGSWRELGPATVWMRMRVPLVAGEEPSPLARVLVAADSGNGVSAALSWRSYVFVNLDLTVHLHRMPISEWVGMDAATRPESTGVGLADTALFDERGRIGRSAQTLLVDQRPG